MFIQERKKENGWRRRRRSFSAKDNKGNDKRNREVKMENGTVTIHASETLTVTVITDNYYDALRSDTAISKQFRTAPNASMHAEHGLSFFIETVINGSSTGFMFDYGVDGRSILSNMALLGIDLGKAAALGLSHGHFDHWGGLIDILKQNRSKIAAGTPLYLGIEAFAQRYSGRFSMDDPTYLGQLDREEIESLGTVKIVEIREPREVIPGCYLTGNIERTTEYEKIPPSLLIKRGDKLEGDLLKGEQAIICNVRGKGLVVISGCAHAGIVNTVKHAQKIAGVDKVHAVIGGFHLVNAKPDIIEKTMADIKQIAPDYIVPTHCTGYEAMTIFAKEMSGQFILNTAGTRYTFSA
jgi:7,8-dihydropterin-6-yl-methyl-4-(beta-D-ribofuranosyl)aminobenzene 5'-phosphate synthase